MKFETTVNLEDVVDCPNVADLLSEKDLQDLGYEVYDDFERDKNSRADWKEKNEEAMKLALQVCQMKTFPWEGAANVKFPLVTVAAMQYSSRAYPSLVNGAHPIVCRPIASPPEVPPISPQMIEQMQQAQAQAKQQSGKGQQVSQVDPQVVQMLNQYKQAQAAYDAQVKQAKHIANHMCFQILEEDTEWEEEMDKLLLIKAILGSAFKKVWFDPVLGHNRSVCVSPMDLYVNYFTKDVETAARITHFMYLSQNEVYEAQALGIYCEFEKGSPRPEPRVDHQSQRIEREGIVPQPGDRDAPFEILEQHRLLDLDGDGYAEPYVVTVRYDTRQVLRIVARFGTKDIVYSPHKKLMRINGFQHFVRYVLIPSPDGGFYGLGFGSLLGPINESINAALNQMLDASTLRTAGGGFLGKGFRGKKGDVRISPGKWISLDSTGDDIRKNVYPNPNPEPSSAMFQLLGLLIEYGQQVAGAVDILQGKNPGQNTPAETSRTMAEQGMKVFNSIYKRAHRSMTREFRQLFKLNADFQTDHYPFFTGVHLDAKKLFNADYITFGILIRPSADPFYMSDAQRLNQATSLLQAAHSSPGYNLYEANMFYLEALKITDPDRFLPDPKGPNAVPPPVNPKIQQEQLKQQGKAQDAQMKMRMKAMELMADADKVRAEIANLTAQAAKAMAEAKGVETGHQIALLEAQIGIKKMKMDGMMQVAKMIHESMESMHDRDHERGMAQLGAAGGNQGVGGASAGASGATQTGLGGSDFHI